MKKFCFAVLMLINTALYSQNYDAGFSKPIITENGNFTYYELPPIQTSEGVLIFLDRNLGALSNDITSSDSWGDLYQWGRATDGHEKRLSDTTNTIALTYRPANNEFIVDSSRANDWIVRPDDDLWNDSLSTNNPCPCGYRLPTEKEWRAVADLGYEIKPTGTGAYYISFGKGQLDLPCAGLRNAFTGNFQYQGMRGYYWAGDVMSKGMSGCMDFNKAEITTNVTVYGFRAFGRSVRCVKKKDF
ncbi:MAG: hypothetical protein IJ250_00100 [Bacteroidales bacterium]|nr:hypothetical protein [Bacteroidales bacterium]